MVDIGTILITVILAVPTAIGVGIGVEFGKDIYNWLKARRKKFKLKLPPMSEEEKAQFREQMGWK